MNLIPTPSSRVLYLDGLRGIASFVVVVSHFIAGFFPPLYFGAEGKESFETLDAIANSPLFVLYSGTFSVFIFFVLSGFVISASAIKSKNNVFVLIIARYFRLTIPVVSSLLMAFLLLLVFAGIPQQAGSIVNHWWLAFMYQPPIPSLSVVFKEGLFNVYWSGISYFNNVLWTMRIELLGSVSIYIIYLIAKTKIRVGLLVLITLWLCFGVRQWPNSLCSFFLGALIYECWAKGWFVSNNRMGVLLILVGLFLGGLPFQPSQGTIYSIIFDYVNILTPAFNTVRIAGAACLLVGIFLCPVVRVFLEAAIPRFLGRISFAIYLVHFPLLCFIGSFCYIHFGQYSVVNMLVLIGFYFFAVLAVSYGFTVFIDEPTLRCISYLKRRIKQHGVRPI